MRLALLLPLVPLVAFAVACDGGDDDAGAGAGAGAGSKAPPSRPALEGPSERESECAAESRKDTYAPGLAKTSGDLEVAIVEATPAPPAKGLNVMTFALRDGAGPIDGATIRMKPYMPDHNHGSAWQPEVTGLGEGRYRIDKIQLQMAGKWSLMMEVTREGHAAENVAYDFCIDEVTAP